MDEAMQAIEQMGARVLFLPPPELKPIERSRAKIKAFLKQAAAHTREAFYQAIG